MDSARHKIDITYGCSGLTARLLENLQALGIDIARLTTRDLRAFDELHIMGRRATMALGKLAGLKRGMRILDIGSGLGGPARRLARGYGCHVTGVDLSDAFVRAAMELTRRVGLAQQVDFRCADALDLPFHDHEFDAVFMIHVNMNVADKDGLVREAMRVVKPGAHLVMWEICTGGGRPPIYPVPWADSEDFSHLITLPAMVQRLQAAGFSELWYEDASDAAVAWVKERLAAMKKPRERKARPDLDLVLKDFRLKRSNVSKNLLGGAISILSARCTK